MQDLVTELGMLGGGRGRSTRKLKCLSLWISVEYRSVSQFLVVDHEFSLGICKFKDVWHTRGGVQLSSGKMREFSAEDGCLEIA